MTDYHLAWLRALALTLVVEVPLVTFLTRRSEPRLWRRWTIATLANLASHPLVWFVFPTLSLPLGVTLVLSEIWAIVVEAIFFRVVFQAISIRRAALVSLAANSASFAIGFLLYETWIAP